MAGYFLLSRAKSIKMIPASLCAFALVISVGPWGMFSVSERSQVQRLKDMLVADSILVDGVVQKAPGALSDENEVQISEILFYLHEVHGFSEIESWFAETLRLDTADAENRFQSPGHVAGLLGVDFRLHRASARNKYFSVYIDPQTPISISDYDHMIRAGYGRLVPSVKPTTQPTDAEIKTTTDSVTVRLVADSARYDSLVVPLRPLIDQIVSAHEESFVSHIPVETATFEFETTGFMARAVMLQARFQRDDSGIVANSYDVLILYSPIGED